MYSPINQIKKLYRDKQRYMYAYICKTLVHQSRKIVLNNAYTWNRISWRHKSPSKQFAPNIGTNPPFSLRIIEKEGAPSYRYFAIFDPIMNRIQTLGKNSRFLEEGKKSRIFFLTLVRTSSSLREREGKVCRPSTRAYLRPHRSSRYPSGAVQ